MHMCETVCFSLGETLLKKGLPQTPTRKLLQIFYMRGGVYLRVDILFVLIVRTTAMRRLMGPRSPTGGLVCTWLFDFKLCDSVEECFLFIIEALTVNEGWLTSDLYSIVLYAFALLSESEVEERVERRVDEVGHADKQHQYAAR